jgi:FeS assembly SUF system protein
MADDVTTPKDQTPEPAAADAPAELRGRVVAALQECYDPEIPVDIYELGLIYNVDIDEGGNTAIKMTLTSPMCPVAGSLPGDVERKVGAVEGVRDVRVDLVWEPPWDKDMMSEAAKLKLNLY